MQDARQQQTAFKHLDLLFQRLVDLGQLLGLLLGFDVVPRQYANLSGGVQQLFAQLAVDAALGLQHLILALALGQGGVAYRLF